MGWAGGRGAAGGEGVCGEGGEGGGVNSTDAAHLLHIHETLIHVFHIHKTLTCMPHSRNAFHTCGAAQQRSYLAPTATNQKPRAHLVLFHAQRLASNHNAARAQHLQTRDVSAPATLPRATKKGRTNCLHKNNRAKRKAHPRGYNFFLGAGRVCTSYCTDRRVHTSYCPDRRVYTSYCPDRRVYTSYCTDRRVYTSYCPDRRVYTSYCTGRRV